MSALTRTPTGSRDGSISQGSPDFGSVSDRTPAIVKTPKRRAESQQVALGKEIKEYKAQMDALSKENERMQRRLESAVAELTKIRSIYESQAAEASHLKTTLHKVNQQKQDIERELSEVKKYARKLESSLTTAAKASLLCEVSSLSAKVATLTGEKERGRAEAERAAVELETVRRENEELRDALQVKAEEFGLVGDVKAQVLFELAEARKEKERAESALLPLEADVTLLKQQLESSLQAIEELKLIREANNEELTRLESSLHSESTLRAELEKELETALSEKTKLLRLLDELDRRCLALKKEAEEQRAQAEQTVNEETETDFEDESERLKAELQDREERISSLKRAHNLEVKKLQDRVAELQKEVEQAKVAALVPVLPPSAPILPPAKQVLPPSPPEPDSALGASSRPDPTRLRALIAEEKKRTEALLRKLKAKPE